MRTARARPGDGAHPPAAASSHRHRTVVGWLIRQLRRHYRAGRAGIDPPAWRRWWRTIGFGAVAMCGLIIVLCWFTRTLVERRVLAGEGGALLWLRDHAFSFNIAVFLQTFGSDVTLILLVAVGAGIAVWTHRPLVALSLISALVVADLVVRFGWLVWGRERPSLLPQELVAPGFHAFPSGHAAKTAAVYGYLVWLWVHASRSNVERLVAVVLLAAVVAAVAVGRLRMGVHWPSDVVAGALVGLTWVGVLARAGRGS